MGDPEVWWLNVINAGLGVLVLVCFLVVALGAVYGKKRA